MSWFRFPGFHWMENAERITGGLFRQPSNGSTGASLPAVLLPIGIERSKPVHIYAGKFDFEHVGFVAGIFKLPCRWMKRLVSIHRAQHCMVVHRLWNDPVY